ncbi:hypothetical protein EVAR_29693_1 [Eumeta japonica]|uniref:Uncharacterized protein n=1 Tax=Eumeta variegata TaxID=151549 RepID=A0A4C1VZH9_EUMVA|nr:hypothetical protein EVAR_29693_1 [Eumeta japonica]
MLNTRMETGRVDMYRVRPHDGSRPIEVPCEPFEQIGQDQETPTLVGAEESEAETEVIHQNVVHLGRELFDDYETKANEKTDTQYSDENQRVRKGKDITMTELQKKLCSEEKKLKVDTYLPVLDMLCTELSRRLEAYREINNLFGF